ncbi:baseplate assembly protein [Erwinia sp. HR93]|nr:baseplate J/gp47 family protein [Erwinia sp. HR93]MEA1064018.1 baseplate J/gp47 family protein [Erwinia sp. HR93]
MALTEPDFIERDADKITAEMIAKYEADTGKTLYPAQAERLLIDLWAYREMLVRVAVQEAAKQNLVAFAREPMIDYLGELVGVYRLAAQPASTTLQFAVDDPLEMDVLIPAGTRVSASNSVIFATDADVVLKAGLLLVNATATCTEPGDAGNGWQVAQVSQLLDEIDSVDLQVSNLAASSGGSEQEDNDRLRERIRLAPESYTNAGSRMAYRFHAMSVHPSIVDVAVPKNIIPGVVLLYPLLSTGLPDAEILQAVYSFCSDEKVRPLTDTVKVISPLQVDYTIAANITIYRDQDANSVKNAASSAIQNWVASRAATLGRDIVPSQIISVLSVEGVYQVELITPALRVVAENEWANCTAITLNITGVSDD